MIFQFKEFTDKHSEARDRLDSICEWTDGKLFSRVPKVTVDDSDSKIMREAISILNKKRNNILKREELISRIKYGICFGVFPGVVSFSILFSLSKVELSTSYALLLSLFMSGICVFFLHALLKCLDYSLTIFVRRDLTNEIDNEISNFVQILDN